MIGLELELDRRAPASLSDQIGDGLRGAIRDGRLTAG
jgi:hypothetical protein